MKRSHLLSALLLPLLFSSMIVLNRCEDEKTVVETVTVRDTVEVMVQIISVDAVYATPDSVTVGGTIALTADITKAAGAGDDVIFRWFSDVGSFDTQVGDTVNWTAPGEEGAYTISVHVTDGENIAIGTKLIGVGMYAPTETPYYIGDVNCQGCHSSTHADWAETGHAHAWAGLMESDHARSYCFPCHSVGYEPEAMTGNSGYDEAPIALFEDVQCENCHGAGSEHVASLSADDIEVSFAVDNCAKCHEGAHHPYATEWEESPHNFLPEEGSHGAGLRGSCAGCHEGVAGALRLSGDVSAFYGGGSVAERPTYEEVAAQPITCQACHSSHSNENPGQLRTVADVPLTTANGESPIITEGGTGKLCMHCHHARRAGESQIAEGYAHFGPHANPQADMAAGKTGYHAVADPGFVWADPSHIKVQNSCKTCHLNMVEYDGTTAITGHTFLPTTAACANCHGEIASFDDIKALEDFDGDGAVEGVQSEVVGLMTLLEAALVDSLEALNLGIDTGADDFDLAHYLGVVDSSTVRMREAGWNWVFVVDDKSKGVHNPDYAVQLLQQSYKHLTGQDVAGASIVRDGSQNAVVRKW